MQLMRTSANRLFYREELRVVEIPFPPRATRQVIIAEVEAEQALVAANRELTACFEKKTPATLVDIWSEESRGGQT